MVIGHLWICKFWELSREQHRLSRSSNKVLTMESRLKERAFMRLSRMQSLRQPLSLLYHQKCNMVIRHWAIVNTSTPVVMMRTQLRLYLQTIWSIRKMRIVQQALMILGTFHPPSLLWLQPTQLQVRDVSPWSSPKTIRDRANVHAWKSRESQKPLKLLDHRRAY